MQHVTVEYVGKKTTTQTQFVKKRVKQAGVLTTQRVGVETEIPFNPNVKKFVEHLPGGARKFSEFNPSVEGKKVFYHDVPIHLAQRMVKDSPKAYKIVVPKAEG
jgi:hypothetical protein